MRVRLLRGCVLSLSLLLVFNTSACSWGTESKGGALKNSLKSNLGTTTAMDTTRITAAAERVMPAVVGISFTRINRDMLNANGKVQGVGSGVIVNNKGYILTNNHVAGGAESLVVSLYDGRNVSGKTIWTDAEQDLAIVKIDANNLETAVIGDSSSVKIGEDAIAIGNPFGLNFQRTVTAGIISAVNRTIEVEKDTFMQGLIQTDASINPGNSGGPLINARGEVVGINTIKVLSAEGLGFAVPVNVIKPIIAKVTSGAKYAPSSVGFQSFDKELGRVFGFTASEGIYVYNCTDGKCAHKAGIRKGDVIIAVDGKPVNSTIEFKEAINNVGAGEAVKLKVKNSKGISDITVILDGVK